MPYLGAHMSIAGGLEQALWRGEQVGCETIQLFTKSPNRWTSEPLSPQEVSRFQQARRDGAISPVVAHDAYLINLASPDPSLWQRSVEAFREEVERCRLLRLPYLVTHVGSHKGSGEEVGLRRIVEALDRVCSGTAGTEVMILLETTAGQGDSIGHRFEQLGWIIQHAACPDRLGICFDTCHVFAAGYELRTPQGYDKTFQQFDEAIGLERLKVFHLNDSRRGLGSQVDRHAHIGQGELGKEAFRLLLNDARFRGHPMLLETPKGPDMEEDRRNLAVLRSLLVSDSAGSGVPLQ